jgi:hypothetical protein
VFDPKSGDDPFVIQYLSLRKAIGIIGMALPFVLALGKVLFESPGILSSISAYYYSDMRNVFVGSLCAIGVFLFSYRGYDWRDALAGKIAAASIVGVAMFPTTADDTPTNLTSKLHVTFALVYFLTLAYFALVLFRKTDPERPPTRQKLWRNHVYTACGVTILACLALIFVAFMIPKSSPLRQLNPVFYLEAIAVIAFGVSWFVKGEGILEDKPAPALVSG